MPRVQELHAVLQRHAVLQPLAALGKSHGLVGDMGRHVAICREDTMGLPGLSKLGRLDGC